MMNTNKNKALVFSGGGARGSFQLGTWKALRAFELEDEITAVYGTSVGAINGAAFVQGDYERAEHIWRSLTYDKVFANVKINPNKKFSRRFYTMARQAIVEKGLDVNPLKKLLREVLDEDRIRSSKRDYGLVVFDWTTKKPIYLRKAEIPEGQLIEYIIASASFPMFQPHRIGNKTYIDGGVYDNRPLSFCENEESISSIFCVDVTIARHFWPNKKKKMKDRIEFIRPSRLLGSPLAFNIARIQRNLDLGYDDTMFYLEKSMATTS